MYRGRHRSRHEIHENHAFTRTCGPHRPGDRRAGANQTRHNRYKRTVCRPPVDRSSSWLSRPPMTSITRDWLVVSRIPDAVCGHRLVRRSALSRAWRDSRTRNRAFFVGAAESSSVLSFRRSRIKRPAAAPRTAPATPHPESASTSRRTRCRGGRRRCSVPLGCGGTPPTSGSGRR